MCKPNPLSTRKLLAAQRSFGGAIGELEQFPPDPVAAQSAPTTSSTQGNGSLTDQRAEHPAGCERIVPIRALLFPPRSLSGALFRRPNSQRGKRECRAKLKILFVRSSLASPGDRLSGLRARIFSAKQRRAIQNKAMSEEGKPRGPRPAGLPSDRVIVSLNSELEAIISPRVSQRPFDLSCGYSWRYWPLSAAPRRGLAGSLPLDGRRCPVGLAGTLALFSHFHITSTPNGVSCGHGMGP